MARDLATHPNRAAADREVGATPMAQAVRDGDTLSGLAERLAEIADALRQRAANPLEVADLEAAAASVTCALRDLAVGAELAANAVIDADRGHVLARTGIAPSPRARAVSWRLHALASALRAARDACAAVPSGAGESRGAATTQRS